MLASKAVSVERLENSSANSSHLPPPSGEDKEMHIFIRSHRNSSVMSIYDLTQEITQKYHKGRKDTSNLKKKNLL